MSFPRYLEYKDSGVEWLGEVPAHWEVKRLRYVAELNPSKSEVRSLSGGTLVSFIPMEAIGEEGTLSLEQARILEDVIDGYTYFRDGDVVVAKITPCFENGKAAVMRDLENGVGLGTTELCVIRPKEPAATSKYLFCVVTSEPFRSLGESQMYGAGGQKRVPDDFVRNFSIAWPPEEEQRDLASFLDYEAGKIDALIEEQRRLIELLKEKRQAVISRAVTKGLDPDVPMKDSGVEWLGEVPVHWDVVKLKYLITSFEQGWSPQCENIPRSSADEWAVLKVGCVNHGRFSPEENKKLPDYLDPDPGLSVRAGDVLISRANTRELVGSAAVVCEDHPGLMISDKIFRLKPGSSSDPGWLGFYLGSDQVRPEIEVEATGASSSMLNIGQSVIKEMSVPLPPRKEQMEILAWLTGALRVLEELQAEVEEALALLAERRAALISAAVTGKIDVRGWSAATEQDDSELAMVAEQRAGYSTPDGAA